MGISRTEKTVYLALGLGVSLLVGMGIMRRIGKSSLADDFAILDPRSWEAIVVGGGGIEPTPGRIIELRDISQRKEHGVRLVSRKVFAGDYSVEVKVKVGNQSCGYACEGWGTGRVKLVEPESRRFIAWEMPWQGGTNPQPTQRFFDSAGTIFYETRQRDDGWHIVKFERLNDTWKFYVDGHLKASSTYNFYKFQVFLTLDSGATYGYPSKMWIDWVRVTPGD